MADHDHFEVLWIRTHEMQPSDMMLPDQRWRDYDRLCRTIHVSRVEHIANGLELDVGFDSVNFTHGSAKGYVFSRKQLPTVPSLDEGVPEADKREGWGIAYRMLGAGWYLFVRED
ncbi:MAG: hypothetical protein JO061_02545 [Acidobacteriaceae bacterium]|nr:hypothetical protein [Acidobacteriaceae bacterium]